MDDWTNTFGVKLEKIDVKSVKMVPLEGEGLKQKQRENEISCAMIELKGDDLEAAKIFAKKFPNFKRVKKVKGNGFVASMFYFKKDSAITVAHKFESFMSNIIMDKVFMFMSSETLMFMRYVPDNRYVEIEIDELEAVE